MYSTILGIRRSNYLDEVTTYFDSFEESLKYVNEIPQEPLTTYSHIHIFNESKLVVSIRTIR